MTEPWQPYPAQPPQGQPYPAQPYPAQPYPAQPPAAPGWQQPANPGYPTGQGYPASNPGYPNPSYPPNPGYPAPQGYSQPPYPQGPGYGGAPVLPAPRSKVPYVIGAVLIVVGIIGAIAAVWWGVSATSDAVAGSTFGSGEDTTVSLQAGEEKVIYVSTAGRSDVNCHLSGDPAHISLKQYSGGLTVNRYEAIFTISADESGDHTLTCTGSDDPTFTVGDDASAPIGLAVGGGFLGGFIAFAGAIVLLVTFLMRRRNAPVALVSAPPYPYQ